MCLGIPGQVVDADAGRPEVVRVDVQGVVRDIGLGLLDGPAPQAGEWVVIHMGFAMQRMTEAEARDALDVLSSLGQDEENDAWLTPQTSGDADADWLSAMARED